MIRPHPGSRNRVYFALALLLVCVALLGAARPAAAQAPSYPVQLGVYVVDVYDVNFPENQVTVEFYVWFNYPKRPDREINPLETFYVVNAKEVEFSRSVTRDDGNRVYQSTYCTAVVKKNWTVADFPFDEHTIRIYIQDSGALGADVVYVPDTENSRLDHSLTISGWQPQPLKIEATTRTWDTSFGDAQLAGRKTETPRILVSFMINRPEGGASVFFKIFAAVLVSVLISFFALLVSPEELEVRAGLTVGALFAAVGSQFVVSGLLPESSLPTLVDNIHSVSYIFIALTVLASVITNNLWKAGKEGTSKAINGFAVILLPVLYLVALAILWVNYFAAGIFTPPSA